MKELLTLSKYSIKNVYGLSALLYNRKKKKRSPLRIVLAVVFILLLLPSYALYLSFASMLYSAYASLNQTSAYPVQFWAITCVVIMIFAASYIISYFYMSKDLDTLLALPVKGRSIIYSKLLTVLVTEYLFVFPIMLPVILIYGINEQAGVVYYFYALLTLLILPLVVLGMVSILVMALMRGANLRLKKDKAQTLILFFTLAIIIAIQFGATKMGSSMGQGDPMAAVETMLQNSNALLDMVAKIFFPATLAGKAMVLHDQIAGLLYLLMFLVLAFIIIVLCGVFGEKVYIQSVLSAKQGAKSETKKKTVHSVKDAKSQSPTAAIFKNDLRLILRTPIFMYNSIGMVVMMPLVLVIMAMASGMQEQISPEIITGYEVPAILIGAAVFAFFAGFNPTAATTFSREGQSFWVTKTMPVTTNEQMNARLATHFLINLATVLLCGIAFSIVLKINIAVPVAAAMLGFLATMPTGYFSLLIDATRPSLMWDTPQKAIKQNVNVLFAGLIQFVYLLFYGGVSVLFLFLLPSRLVALVMIVLFGILIAVLCDRIVRKKFQKIFFDIDF